MGRIFIDKHTYTQNQKIMQDNFNLTGWVRNKKMLTENIEEEVDGFENSDNLPEDVKELLDMWSDKLSHGQGGYDAVGEMLDDFENLFHMDYKPKNTKFKQMMEYVMANKEKIDKYRKYDPDHYFVLVKDNEVQYRLNSAKGEQPRKVPSKDDLPDDIKGKLFVLDIGDKQSFVEDIGLKENDGAYWIIA
jgi:hypothetical protein